MQCRISAKLNHVDIVHDVAEEFELNASLLSPTPAPGLTAALQHCSVGVTHGNCCECWSPDYWPPLLITPLSWAECFMRVFPLVL